MKNGRTKGKQVRKQARKVTVSIPEDLLEFADQAANESDGSRSSIVAAALEVFRNAKRDMLLADGYRFYAEADRDLAEEGLAATNEVLPPYETR